MCNSDKLLKTNRSSATLCACMKCYTERNMQSKNEKFAPKKTLNISVVTCGTPSVTVNQVMLATIKS